MAFQFFHMKRPLGVRVCPHDPPTEWIEQFAFVGLNLIAAAPAQDPEQRVAPKRNCRYPYKNKASQRGFVVRGVGRYREHSDEAA